MKKAFAYLRVSGRAQLEGDGFPRQDSEITHFAEHNDIEIVCSFPERALPGKTDWEDRPAWVQMISSLNGVKTIVIERLDRLARDLGVQEWIMKDLKERGIELVSTCEPDLASDDPTRILFRQIMGAIAAYDKSMIVLKLRGSRQRKKAEAGRCEGAKPYGFNNGETEIIQKICNMKSTGCGLREISRRLNKEGIPARRGGLWHAKVISHILRASACA